MGFMAFRQDLEGLGRPGPATVLTLFGLGLNVVADLALIYGVRGFVPALGVVGAGWATTLVRWAMLIALLGYLLRHPGLHPARAPRALDPHPGGVARARTRVAVARPCSCGRIACGLAEA